MFVATTLAISLALSPVTTQLGSRLVEAPRAYAWMAPAAPASTGDCPKLEFRTVLQVDTKTLSDDAQGIGSRLRSKAEQAITSVDVMLGEDAGRLPAVVIKIVPLTGEDEGFSFTIDINHANETPIKDGSSVGECKLCTESELLEKVAGSLRALMPKLRAHITDFNNRPCVPTPECDADATCRAKNPNLPVCHPGEKRCVADLRGGCDSDLDCSRSPVGPLCHPQKHTCVASLDAPPPSGGLNGKQKAGIGLMIGGALGVGVGIGLVANKPKAVDPMMGWETRETQKPGFAVLAVGGAALVTGVVLFILGRRQQPRSAVSPVAGSGMVGLTWSGRF